MIIKVGHSELYDVTKTLNQDKEDYDAEIDKMLEIIERMKGVWSGTDANTFYSKAYEYINNMKKITTAMGNISTFTDKSNSGYAEVDESFSKEMEQEANNYGDEDELLEKLQQSE